MLPPDITVYRRAASVHIRDGAGNHWVVAEARNGDFYHRVVPRRGHALHNRYGVDRDAWPLRGLRHGIMNIVTQEGGWSWYTGFGGQKHQRGDVEHGYVPARHHTAVMNAEMGVVFGDGRARTATEYARAPDGVWGSSSLPVWSTRGHSGIRYEWCHLVAHGLQGPDLPVNIVAATAYQNSEQLIIECVLYEYRMEGLNVDVRAKLASGTTHLAESIYYQILLNGRRVYSRTMDGRRATRPTYQEFGQVAEEIRAAINAHLAIQYPVAVNDGEILGYIATQLPVNNDEALAEDLWDGIGGF